MRSLIALAAIFVTFGIEHAVSQVRNAPAPTGQIPRSAPGQRPFAGYQPKPTGQIAPATSVQVSGAPVTVQPAQAALPGQVPKVNTNQDPRTFPERYQPDAATPKQEVITNLETQFLQQQQQNPASVPGTTTTPVQQSTTVTTGQPQTTTTTTPAQHSTTSTSTTTQSAPLRSPSQIQSLSQPQTQQQTNAPAATSPKRVEP